MAMTLLSAAEGMTALGAALVLGLCGLGAALGMGMAIMKSVDAIGRQPEAEKKIRTTLMIGLAFIETLALYSIVVAIMILFV